ncbi:hypothetical protein H8D85_01100 [bacterium]|nr:hypothetical protein [bacterium]
MSQTTEKTNSITTNLTNITSEATQIRVAKPVVTNVLHMGGARFTVENTIKKGIGVTRKKAQEIINNINASMGLPNDLRVNTRTLKTFNTAISNGKTITGHTGMDMYLRLVKFVREDKYSPAYCKELLNNLGADVSLSTIVYHVNKIKGKNNPVPNDNRKGSRKNPLVHLTTVTTDKYGVTAPRRETVKGTYATHRQNIHTSILRDRLSISEAQVMATFTPTEIDQLDVNHLVSLVNSGERRVGYVANKMGIKNTIKSWGFAITALTKSLFNPTAQA